MFGMILAKFLILPILIILVFVLFIYTGMHTMALFAKRVPIHLSPEIQGVIKNQGEPLANVQVQRSIYLNFTGDYYIDKTISDDQGHFRFADKTVALKKPSSFTTVVKRFELYVRYKNEPVSIWLMNIHTLEPVMQIKQRLQVIDCDLVNQEQPFDFIDDRYPSRVYSVLTRCRWGDD